MASVSAGHGNGPPGSPPRRDESDLTTNNDEGGEQTPPGSPGQSTDNDDGPAKSCNVVLSTISMWVDRLPAREVETLVMKHFSCEKLKAAVTEMKKFLGCSMSQQVDMLARNLVGAVIKLGQAEQPIVEFFVKSTELFTVPGVESSLMPLDVSSIGARLLGMEANMEVLTTSMQQMGNVGKAVDTLASVVTSLQEQQRQVLAPPVHVESLRAESRPKAQSQQQLLYSAIVAESAAGKRKRVESSPTSPHQETPRRQQPVTPPSAVFQAALIQNGVSHMLKEQRTVAKEQAAELNEDGFQLVLGNQRKLLRRKKLLQGASEVTAGGGVPVPFSVFIRNTDPNYSDGDVKRYLEECAEALPPGEKLSEKLEILQVCNIPIKRTDGGPLRSKCWKVSVPSQFKEHMLNPKAYPSSWFARQWFRNANQLTGAANLQQNSNTADNVQQRVNINNDDNLLRNSSSEAALLQNGNTGIGHTATDGGA